MRKGFTLIEVLVVLGIITFLIMIIVPLVKGPSPPPIVKKAGLEYPYSIHVFVLEGVKYTILVRDSGDARAGSAMIKLKEEPVRIVPAE